MLKTRSGHRNILLINTTCGSVVLAMPASILDNFILLFNHLFKKTNYYFLEIDASGSNSAGKKAFLEFLLLLFGDEKSILRAACYGFDIGSGAKDNAAKPEGPST